MSKRENGKLLLLPRTQKNHNLFEKAHLPRTKTDLKTIQGKIEKFDIAERCTQERQNSKWRLKLTFISKSGYNPKNSRGVSIDDLPLVVDRKRLIYNFDIQEEEKYREIVRQRIRKIVKTMKLLRCNNQIIHRNNTDTFFKCFGFSSCDSVFNRSDNFNRHLPTS